jgi:hypothetical protein
MNDHFWPSLYPGIIVGATAGAFLCEFCSSRLAAILRQGQ